MTAPDPFEGSLPWPTLRDYFGVAFNPNDLAVCLVCAAAVRNPVVHIEWHRGLRSCDATRFEESWRERSTIATELGQRAWPMMVEENSERWNKARLVAVLRRRVK